MIALILGSFAASSPNAAGAQSNELGSMMVDSLIARADNLVEASPDSALDYLDMALESGKADAGQGLSITKLQADAYYYKYDFQTAASHYKEAAARAIEVYGAGSLYHAERLGDAGFCYYRMVDYENAVAYYQQALAIVRELDHKPEIATNLNNIGLIYNTWGNYDSAIHYHSAALEIDKAIGDPYFISVDYNNIGKIYQAWGKLDRALEYYEESLIFADSSGRENSIAIRLNNIGMIHKQKKDYKKALEYIERALEIDTRLNNRYRMGVRYHNLGQIHDVMGHRSLGKDYYLKALELFREVQNIEATAMVYRSLGEHYFEQDRYHEAESYCLKSLRIADSINLATLTLDNYELLAILYEKMGEPQKALAFFKVYSAQKDSIFSQNEQALITEYQTKYETRKKEQEIELLNKAQEISALELRKVSIQRYAFLVTIVLLVVIILLIILKYRYKHQMNSMLAEKNAKLEELNATKDKFFTILSHDLRNPLSGIRNLSQSLASNLSSLKKDDLGQMVNSLHHSSNHVFEMTQNLLNWAQTQRKGQPVNPGNLSLGELIERNLNLHKARAESKDIDLKMEDSNGHQVYADEQMVNTVLRNLISNAIKFTPRGGQVVVKTAANEKFMRIAVTDTGIGIAEEDTKKLFRIDQDVKTIGQSDEKGTGLGLIICREFIRKNNGDITVESQPGRGSSFIFTLPLVDNQ